MVLWSTAAWAEPVSLGPFALGGSEASFGAAAKDAGFTKPQRQAPQERDIMGLGLMYVRPIIAESQLSEPDGKNPWIVTGYLLSGRLLYLSFDYGLEDPERAQAWFEKFNAPLHIRKRVQDTSWHHKGAVIHGDRFGRSVHAVDWQGLRQSNRVLVSLEGAVKVADRFFREVRARQLEVSLDLIRQRIINYFQRSDGGGTGRACAAPPAVELTPAAGACDLAERRFSLSSDAWKNATWKALGIRAHEVSRYYSYRITSSGTASDTRIVLLARGDLDCNGDISTVRVVLRANPRADRFDCTLDTGRWEISNPLE
jgi:hypothetical protein